jgi:tryptophanyl-tRNA synthetase
MKSVVSGIQPTGILHLGNYLGFVKNNINFLSKEKRKAFLFIADLHAITNFKDSVEISKGTIKVVATYLACGFTPELCNLFVQSKCSEHAELAWILGCYTSLGWLNRMTQFKEKSVKYKTGAASLGLYSYPVLQAADILIYQADYVPVGEDQVQHIELTRDIATAFNQKTGVEFFKLPEAVVLKGTGRIMSLRDGRKKMSKSDNSDYSRINLTDSPDDIRRKIQKAKTDAIKGISFDPEIRPEISNLIKIYASLSEFSVEKVVQKYSESNCSAFKNDLSDLIISELEPINKKIKDFLSDRSYINEVLKKGHEAAQPIAEDTLNKAKKIVGFI